MHTPICELCAVTGELCSGCQQRLEKGEITKTDVKLAEVLQKNRKRLALEDVDARRTLDLGKMLVILSDSEPGLLIGKGGKVVNALGKEFGRHIRIIPSNIEFKRFAEELLLPVKPLGINTLYTQKGQQECRVRIARKDLPRLPADLESLKGALSWKCGKPVSLAAE